MAQFLTPLRLEKVGPQRWLVGQSLEFQSDELQAHLIVPGGFQTDLASVPWFAQWLVSKVGRYDAAAVLHDCAYAGQLLVQDETGHRQPIRLIKPVADRLFREALIASGVKPRTANGMYAAVSWFGRKAQRP